MNHYTKRHPAAPITRGQITVIKMAQSALGISEDIYRDTLEIRYGVRSCTGLNFEQANDLIEDYKSRGFVLTPSAKPKKPKQPYPPRPARNNGKVIALASRAEIDKLNAVAALIPWREENGLALFLIKRMNIPSGKVRTSAEAYRAIEGVKKMFENGMKKAHGENWWCLPWVDSGIRAYIAEHCPEEYRK